MPRQYSDDERDDALKRLIHNGGDVARTSRETDIPASTLRGWQERHHKTRGDRIRVQLEHLHERLIQNTLQLVEAVEGQIDNAPLNQLTSAVGTLFDRYLKLDEHLAQFNLTEGEQIVRIEYKYPDGTIHDSPPWAEADSDDALTVQSGGVWQAVRQDDDGEDQHHRAPDSWADLLVARADLSHGEPGVARYKDDLAAFSRIADKRDGAAD